MATKKMISSIRGTYVFTSELKPRNEDGRNMEENGRSKAELLWKRAAIGMVRKRNEFRPASRGQEALSRNEEARGRNSNNNDEETQTTPRSAQERLRAALDSLVRPQSAPAAAGGLRRSRRSYMENKEIESFKLPRPLTVNSEERILMTCAKGDLREMIKLCKHDRKCLEFRGARGLTGLHFASQNGHLPLVRVMTARFHVDLTVTNDDGDTPLHLAAYHGHLDVVRFLLTSQGKSELINAVTSNGETALYQAAERGNFAIACELLCHGADGAIREKYAGETALDACKSSSPKLYSFLQLCHAKPTQQLKPSLQILSLFNAPFFQAYLPPSHAHQVALLCKLSNALSLVSPP